MFCLYSCRRPISDRFDSNDSIVIHLFNHKGPKLESLPVSSSPKNKVNNDPKTTTHPPASNPSSSSRNTMPMKPLPKTRNAPVGHSKELGDNDATARTGSKACSSILVVENHWAQRINNPKESWVNLFSLRLSNRPNSKTKKNFCHMKWTEGHIHCHTR